MIIFGVIVSYFVIGLWSSRYAARWAWSMRSSSTSGEVDAEMMGWVTVFFWPLTFLFLGWRWAWRKVLGGPSFHRNWVMRDVK